MTVEASAPIKIAYPGDGVTTGPFTTPQFISDPDILAVLSDDATGAETPLVLGTDYTLTGQGNPSGGTLTTIGPLSPHQVGETLTVKTDPLRSQPTDFVEGGDFTSTGLESSLDRGALIDKAQEEVFARTLSFPVSDTASTAELPPAQDRAGNILTFDASGNPAVTNSIELFTKTISVTAAQSPYTVTDADAGAILRVDTSGGPVTLSFSDASLLTTPSGDFGAISISNQNNPVTLTAAVAGQLRSQNGTAEWSATLDPVYAGTSDATNGAGADEAEVRIKRFGGLWVLNGGLREQAVQNREILTRASLMLQRTETGAVTFAASDHGTEIYFTGVTPETWTIPVLPAGTVVNLHNFGIANITLATSGTTLVGNTTLEPNKAGTLIWTPVGAAVRAVGEFI